MCRFFPPFGEIVILITQFGKTQSQLKIVSSLSVRFFNSFKSKYLNFFFYLFDCQVSFGSALVGFLFPSPSCDDRSSKLASLELCLSGLPDWSVWMDSNHRPRAYQARALATWATDRFFLRFFSSSISQGFILDGGDEGIRTLDPLLAGQVLSQLSYTPIWLGLFLRTQLNPDNWTTKSFRTEYSYTSTRFFVLIWLRVLKNVSRS